MKKFAVVALLASLMAGATAVQAKETPASTAVKTLVGVPTPELPATVLKAVQSAAKADRPAVLNALIRRVAKTSPAAARAVVTAVAKADPSLASVAAASAARATPSDVRDIVVAACAAAPEKSAEIIALCSKSTVVSQGALAQMVGQANPSVNAVALAREASLVRVSVVGAAAPSGGFIFFPQPSGDIIGYTINGDEVTGDPTGTTGQDGGDKGRDPVYTKAGS